MKNGAKISAIPNISKIFHLDKEDVGALSPNNLFLPSLPLFSYDLGFQSAQKLSWPQKIFLVHFWKLEVICLRKGCKSVEFMEKYERFLLPGRNVFFLQYFLARWSIRGVDGGTWTLPSSCRPTPAAGRMRPKLLPRLPGQLPRMCCRSASSNEPPKVPPQLKAVSEWSLLTLESQNKEGWITKDSFKRCACLKRVPTKAPLTKKKLICGSKETNIFLFWDYIDIWKMARCSCWQGFRKSNWNSKQRHQHAQRRLLKGNEGRVPFAATTCGTRHNMYLPKYFLSICQIPKDRYKH